MLSDINIYPTFLYMLLSIISVHVYAYIIISLVRNTTDILLGKRDDE